MKMSSKKIWFVATSTLLAGHLGCAGGMRAPEPAGAPQERSESTGADPVTVATSDEGDSDGEAAYGRETITSLDEDRVSGPTTGEQKPPTEKQPDDQRFSELPIVRTKPLSDMYFKHWGTNPTIDTREESTSTFSVDVDTASYALARRYLQGGNLPAEAAVRVEEFINSFDYGYEPPTDFPFSVQAEAFPSPNRQGYHVLHLGLKGREVSAQSRKPANLAFVIDVSGSMSRGDRLGTVKKALRMLVEQLDERDSVGIVVYGTTAHEVLGLTSATDRARILAAIDRLVPEGSTNVQAGLQLAYAMLGRSRLEGGINRIILCSDGVANNGVTNADGIFETITKAARRGITLSAVGFGMGNYNDALMERLADAGDGNYAYVDRLEEARRVFVENLSGTLQVIAKDVKVQVEFDPRYVARYRLLGYENRVLDNRDFSNDQVDAGEIGAGHAVTAIYEVKFISAPEVFGVLRLRYKEPEGGRSKLIERPLPGRIVHPSFAGVSPPTRLSMISAGFAEKLRGSYWARNLSYGELLTLWKDLPSALAQRADVRELRDLIERADRLDRRGDKFEKDEPVASMDFDHVPVLR